VLRETRHDIVFLGLSDAWRDRRASLRRHLARSGPRILPWLFVEFAAPRLWRRGSVGPVGSAAFARGVPATTVASVNSAATQGMLEALRPDLIVTCHFDQILAPETIATARLGAINLHPSLLPAFKGLHTHRQALAAGVAEHGTSVHVVTPGLDDGPVIAQARVPVLPGDDEAALAARVRAIEHPLLIESVRLLASGRLRLSGGRIFLNDAPLAVPLQPAATPPSA